MKNPNLFHSEEMDYYFITAYQIIKSYRYPQLK